MMNLIYINACMRAGSRTQRIATPIIQELCKRYNVETVDLTKNMYPVADNNTLKTGTRELFLRNMLPLPRRLLQPTGLSLPHHSGT